MTGGIDQGGMGPSLRQVFEFLKKEMNSIPDPTLPEQMQLALLIRVIWGQREEYKSISERLLSAALRNQHAMLWDMEPGTKDRFENFLREERQAEWHRRKDQDIREDHAKLQQLYDELDSILATMRHHRLHFR